MSSGYGSHGIPVPAPGVKRLLYYWLWWAKPLSTRLLIVLVVLCGLRIEPMVSSDYRNRRPAAWQVPALRDLHYVDGVLEEPLLQSKRSRFESGLF